MASEDKETVSSLMDIFKERSNMPGIKVMMADKDLVDRQVLKDKILYASLQICLFHVLQTLWREFRVEKRFIL